MAMKWYTTFHKAAGVEHHRQMQLSVKPLVFFGWGSYSSVGIQSAYSKAQANRKNARKYYRLIFGLCIKRLVNSQAFMYQLFKFKKKTNFMVNII